MEKPMPVPDSYSAFYWEHAAKGQLAIQGFEGSDYVQYPPNAVAETPDVDGAPIPVVVAGTGVLYAYTVLHQAFHPAWADSLPYVIGLTELKDHPGIRILTNIVEVDRAKLRSGMPVEVTFEDRGTMRLPQFRPVETGDRA
jgi:uncharacterized OB-fold protein